MHENILAIWSAASDTERQQGSEWYVKAHEFCAGLADEFGITVQQAAGVTAALSPMLSWEKNLVLARTVVETGDAPCLKGNVRKANAILEGIDPLDVLGGFKVRSFYHNIADPATSRAVTIDRHAFDIAVGCTTDDKVRKALARRGMYQAFARLYRDAADAVGVLPHVMQAATWIHWKATKTYDHAQHASLYQTTKALAAASMV